MMLRRAAVPLLRPTPLQLSGRIALPRPHVRYYAKNDRLRRREDYKLPETAQTAPWQRSSSSSSNSRSNKQPLRPVPVAPNENLKVPPESKAPTDENLGQGFGYGKQADEQIVEETAEPAEPRLSQTIEESTRKPDQELESESEPQRPLPDLTKGIPSTLAAELSQARPRQTATSPSLNITENPEEPIPHPEERGGQGGDRTSRSEYVSSSDRKKNAAFKYMYYVLGIGIVGYTTYLGRNWDTAEEERKHAAAPSGWGFGLFYNRVMARLGSTMSYYNDPVTTKLLPDEEADPNFRAPFTLVLSLEDFLVHAEWTRQNGWRIAKRPGLDYFLRYLSQYYELVLFTSQPSVMGEQVLRKLDPYSMIRWPLFREATLYKDGGYIKDLSYLNRDLKKVIIMDTDAHHVRHQPENAILIPKWTGDPNDQTLVQFIPFLEYLANMGFDDARTVLRSFEGKYIPAEFARREKLLREKFEAQEAEKRKKRPKRSVSGLGSLFGVKQQSADGLGSPDEAMAEGKMLWDQIRERGQRQYQELDKKIREEGAKWLAEREAEEKRYQEEAMKSMKSGMFGWFGGGGGGGEQKK